MQFRKIKEKNTHTYDITNGPPICEPSSGLPTNIINTVIREIWSRKRILEIIVVSNFC